MLMKSPHTRYLLIAALAAIAGFLWPAGIVPLHAQDEMRIVVLVNDTPISAYDVEQRTRFLALTRNQKPSDALREKATEELISESIQLQEAQKNGISVGQSEINEAVKNLAEKNNISTDKLEAALRQQGVNIRTLKRKFEAQIAWGRVVRAKFRNQISVGDKEIDEALSERQPEGGGEQKTEFRLQRVSFTLPENPEQTTIARRLAEAEELRKRVRSCEQISDAVGRYSDASVKSLGRKSAEEVPQPSRALLNNAETGGLTPAYITATGVELYALCGKRTVQANNKQREQIQRELAGEQFEILARRHLRDLRQEAFVEHR
jgi:peptidyl-prolyl cis-trans isomerase SurA